jgi:hypothetical protein
MSAVTVRNLSELLWAETRCRQKICFEYLEKSDKYKDRISCVVTSYMQWHMCGLWLGTADWNHQRIVAERGLTSQRCGNIGYQVQAFGCLSIYLHNLLVSRRRKRMKPPAVCEPQDGYLCFTESMILISRYDINTGYNLISFIKFSFQTDSW